MLCDGLQQLLFHKFVVSHWGAKDDDSLIQLCPCGCLSTLSLRDQQLLQLAPCAH